MQYRTPNDDVIALAGVFQAVTLVRQAARQGEVNSPDFHTCMESVLRLDSQSTLEIFGEISNLKTGFRELRDHLGRRPGRPDAEITGYVVALMFLERKLIRSRSMLESLREGIQEAEHISETPSHPEVVSALAQLYSETISRLNPRILVHGVPEFLNEASIADKIRSLLLAGMRATVLWRQVGGSRLRLLFGRKRALAQTELALRRMDNNVPLNK